MGSRSTLRIGKNDELLLQWYKKAMQYAAGESYTSKAITYALEYFIRNASCTTIARIHFKPNSLVKTADAIPYYTSSLLVQGFYRQLKQAGIATSTAVKTILEQSIEIGDDETEEFFLSLDTYHLRKEGISVLEMLAKKAVEEPQEVVENRPETKVKKDMVVKKQNPSQKPVAVTDSKEIGNLASLVCSWNQAAKQ